MLCIWQITTVHESKLQALYGMICLLALLDTLQRSSSGFCCLSDSAQHTGELAHAPANVLTHAHSQLQLKLHIHAAARSKVAIGIYAVRPQSFVTASLYVANFSCSGMICICVVTAG